MAQQSIGAGAGKEIYLYLPDQYYPYQPSNTPKTVLEDVFPGQPGKILEDFPFTIQPGQPMGVPQNFGIGFGSKILLAALGIFFILMLFKR